jgi:hypothetical protein
MAIILDGSEGITQADKFNSNATFGFRNRIINGDMRIDQRNAGASVTPADNTYTLDRWLSRQVGASSKFSVQQSSTVPTGFNNSLLVTSLSAYSVNASDFFAQEQRIEGFNVADLGWGTANAKTVTLSFWVRSSLTGTFGGALRNNDNNRSYPFTYTISAADTWEQKIVTVAGDTTGSWNTTNAIGLRTTFGLGVGATNSGTAGAWAGTQYLSATGAVSVVGTNGATWYVTGVQLEAGSVATPFERRPYGTELQLCQRYCIRYKSDVQFFRFALGECPATTLLQSYVYFPVEMRTEPTLTVTATASDYVVFSANTLTNCSTVPSIVSSSSSKLGVLDCTVASGLTAGRAGALLSNNTNAFLQFNAEL